MRNVWFAALGLSLIVIMWALMPQYSARVTAADTSIGLVQHQSDDAVQKNASAR
jgi:hypothetical protein